MYITALNKKVIMNLKEGKEGYVGGFIGGKGRRTDVMILQSLE